MTIYVGNLPYDCSKEDICELFAKFGPVKSVMIPTDKEQNNRPRGFCFVELKGEDDSNEDASNREDIAIRELNQPDSLGRSLCVIGGRTAIVCKAKPREDNRSRSSSPSGSRTGPRPFGNRDNRSRSTSAGSRFDGSSSREGSSREGYSSRGSNFRNSNSNRNEG